MTTDTVGGVWTFTLELARQLSKWGVEVLLAALGGEPSAQQATEAQQIPGLCLMGSGWKLEWMEEPWNDVAMSGEWLLRLENDYRPDVVHLNSFGHGTLPWRAPAVLTAHSCVVSWWQAVRGDDAPAEWNRYRGVVRESLRAVSAVTAPSLAMARTLGSNYGLEASRVRVIPNGVRQDFFYRAAKEPIVLTVGRLWDAAKNAAAVAAVAGKLGWPVYAAGAEESPAGERISLEGAHLLGRLSAEELAEWYARASVFALPARYEPFGLSAAEAALSGCALVLGDIPSLREVWGAAALFVPPDDVKALGATLRSLTENDELRAEMARRSFERARTFDPARNAGLYLDAYRSALRGATERTVCVS